MMDALGTDDHISITGAMRMLPLFDPLFREASAAAQ
jgi:hypothetical protein